MENEMEAGILQRWEWLFVSKNWSPFTELQSSCLGTYRDIQGSGFPKLGVLCLEVLLIRIKAFCGYREWALLPGK